MSAETEVGHDDLEDANVDVAEALRDMGNSTGDAGLLHLAQEVADEDDRNQQKSDENESEDKPSYPPVPEELSHLPPLDIFSQGFLKFLVGMKVYTASDFLSRDVHSFVRPYEEWRLSLNPYTSLTPGSARDYVQKWRKRLRQHIESLGVSTDDELGSAKDYLIASPSFITTGRISQSTQTPKVPEKRKKQSFAPVVKKPSASLPSASLPSHLAGMQQLDILSHGILNFLLHIKVYTASEFLLQQVNTFVGPYEEWRTARNPNTSLTPGSARDFINKWRKRIRQHISALGIDTERDLGKKVDYIIASPHMSSSKPASENNSPRKMAKKARYSLPTSHSVSQTPKASETKFVSLTLNEPGTFGLKVENTPTNGVRISEVLPGLQGERGGFQTGDIIASATLDTTNFEPDLSKLWGQDMIFDDFVRVAQSQVRPIIVRVRRGGPELQPVTSSPSKKRGRPRKPEKDLKRRRRGESAPLPIVVRGPSADAIRRFEIKRLRVMREEIIRAHSLRSVADDFDKALVKALKHNPLAVIKARDMSQSMREEFQEIWNNPSHGEWEENLKTLLEYQQMHGHVEVPNSHPDKKLLKFMNDMQNVKRSLKSIKQRNVKNRDKARMEVDILNMVGFKWKDQDNTRNFEAGFQELEEYRKKFGTLMIPKEKKFGEYAGLHKWMLLQRRKYKLTKSGKTNLKPSETLHEDQIRRLNDIGFPWLKSEERTWDSYFEELLEFKLKNGHCYVPVKRSRKLAGWANQMRDLKAKKDAGEKVEVLTDERVRMLNYFGFNWDGKKKQNFGNTEAAAGGASDAEEGGDASGAEEEGGNGAEEQVDSDVETYENASKSISGQTPNEKKILEESDSTEKEESTPQKIVDQIVDLVAEGDGDVAYEGPLQKAIESEAGDVKSSSKDISQASEAEVDSDNKKESNETTQNEKTLQDAQSDRLEL